MKRDTPEDGIVDVTLEAAPAGVPAVVQVRRSQIVDRKIKLMRCGGYDHFELVAMASENDSRAVFRWTMRTKIAE
jgi:hypothetical protein